MKKISLLVLVLSWSLIGSAQEDLEKVDQKIHLFIAYELGEGAFNKMQSLSGEIGLRFKNNHLFRLAHMNIKFTEGHLSSKFAKGVDGPNVEGKMVGFEAFYDFPALTKGLYVAPSIGYYKSEYSHTILDEEVKHEYAPTIGAAISYRETNLFGVRGMYTALSVPIRVSLDPGKKTKLGETTIASTVFDQNIWFYIGFEF